MSETNPFISSRPSTIDVYPSTTSHLGITADVIALRQDWQGMNEAWVREAQKEEECKRAAQEREVYAFELVEQLPHVDLDETSEKSIFKDYSIPFELAFLRDNNDMSFEEKQFYIEQNVLRFLGEFVGHVPYATVQYQMTNGKLHYGSQEMMTLCENALKIEGTGGRAEHEKIGCQKIEQALANGKDMAIWLSPPKIADYSFAMFWQRVYNPQLKQFVHEQILLEYPEEKGTTTRSQEIMEIIQPGHNLRTTNDFLDNPVICSGDAQSTLEGLMNAIGITAEDILRSKNFDQGIKANFGKWMKDYAIIADVTARLAPEDPRYEECEKAVKKMLHLMYVGAGNMVKEQKSYSVDDVSTRTIAQFPRSEYEDMQLMYLFAQERAEKDRNSDCVSVSNTSPSSHHVRFVDHADILTGATISTSNIDSILAKQDRYPDYECPSCKGMVQGELKGTSPKDWKKNCPHCGSGDIHCAKTSTAKD